MDTKNNMNGGVGQTSAATLGEKLDALAGIIGHRFRAHMFSGRFVAQRLGIDPAQWTRKRNGQAKILRHELAHLIQLYGLGKYVDDTIFDAPDIETFRRLLKSAGVGTYAGSYRMQLSQRLHEASLSHSHSIKLVNIKRPNLRTGLGIGRAAGEPGPVLRIGGKANIECRGPAGRHLIVFNAHLDGDMALLMPSEMAPETLVANHQITLPSAPGHAAFEIEDRVGHYRLYALWTDGSFAAIAHQAVDPHGLDFELTDEIAGRMVDALPAPAELDAASLDYRIEA